MIVAEEIPSAAQTGNSIQRRLAAAKRGGSRRLKKRALDKLLSGKLQRTIEVWRPA
ncbi:MAG TPA: hypothetical protein VJ747_12805 [Stellaceae bacterium]|nr:hypothetical protein [Stellaceae bacterium]